MRQLYFVLLLLAAGLASCRKAPLASCDASQALFAAYLFPVGVAINPVELYPGNDYQRLATQHFNSVTPENIFKPNYLHPGAGQYDWQAADQLAAFCRAHH